MPALVPPLLPLRQQVPPGVSLTAVRAFAWRPHAGQHYDGNGALPDQPDQTAPRSGTLHGAASRGRFGGLPRWRSSSLTKEDCAALQAAFHTENIARVQDVLLSASLAEAAYKTVDFGDHKATELANELLQDLVPPQLTSLQSLQWCNPHVRHRYVLAEAGDTVYIAFIGTKLRRDLVTNANAVLERMWDDQEASSELEGPPAAHRGFWRRAAAVPIESIFEAACRRGKRLVLCGHSLGGAVAMLCTLRLLRQLPKRQDLPISCIAFATPSIGNAALSALVAERRWDAYLSNFLLPEDVVVQLTSPSQYRSMGSIVGAAGEGETRPDMRRLLNPTVSMIATAATLTGLAAAAGVPTTAAAAASAAAVAARARWGGKPGEQLIARAGASPDLSAAQQMDTPETTAALLAEADAALLRASGVSGDVGTSAVASSQPPQMQLRPALLERLQRAVSPAASRDESPSGRSECRSNSSHTGSPGGNSAAAAGHPQAAQSGVPGRKGESAGASSMSDAGSAAGNDADADSAARIPPGRTLLAAQGVTQSRSMVVQQAASSAADEQPGAAAAAAAKSKGPAAAGWHWGPPDTAKAAAWASARAARFASLPVAGMRGAADFVSYPVRKAMSAARAFVPLSGAQLYVLPSRITRDAQDLATKAAAAPALGFRSAAGDGALRDAADTGGESDVSGVASALDRQEAEELSAQEAERRGAKGGLFLMHRMASYRARLKTVWHNAVGPERAVAWQAGDTWPFVPLVDDLAPRMRQLRAEGVLPELNPAQKLDRLLVLPQGSDTATGQRARPEEHLLWTAVRLRMRHHGALRSRWPPFRPLTWLAQQRTVPARPGTVEVDVTVLGVGLEHCTGVRVSVAATGAACPLRIVRQPQLRFDGEALLPPPEQPTEWARVASSVPTFFARVQQAANAVIRSPETALLDSMSLRVSIPSAMAQACSINDASSGGGQLTIQLQSDFQQVELPLDLCSTDVATVLGQEVQRFLKLKNA